MHASAYSWTLKKPEALRWTFIYGLDCLSHFAEPWTILTIQLIPFQFQKVKATWLWAFKEEGHLRSSLGKIWWGSYHCHLPVKMVSDLSFSLLSVPASKTSTPPSSPSLRVTLWSLETEIVPCVAVDLSQSSPSRRTQSSTFTLNLLFFGFAPLKLLEYVSTATKHFKEQIRTSLQSAWPRRRCVPLTVQIEQSDWCRHYADTILQDPWKCRLYYFHVKLDLHLDSVRPRDMIKIARQDDPRASVPVSMYTRPKKLNQKIAEYLPLLWAGIFRLMNFEFPTPKSPSV